MVTLVQCAEFQSLSTSTSTSISGANSSVASLSTSVSSAMSGSLSNVNSSVASLSTSTSTALSGATGAVNSSVALLSTSTSTGLSTVNSSVASLSTSTSTGLSTVNSSVASLSTSLRAVTVLPSAATPTAPPAAGEPTKAINTQGEVFEYVDGAGWTLVAKGHTDRRVEQNVSGASGLLGATLTFPRDGVVVLNGEVYTNTVTEPSAYLYTVLVIMSGSAVEYQAVGDTRTYPTPINYNNVSISSRAINVSAGQSVLCRVDCDDAAATFEVSVAYRYIE